LMMLVVGWSESAMTTKHKRKIRAMDSGVLLTANDTTDPGDTALSPALFMI